MKIKYLMAMLVVGSFSLSQAHATVINFDDLGDSGQYGTQIPSNYQGFNWGSDLAWFSDTYYTGPSHGNSYGSPSGENAAFNYGGVVNAELIGASPFDFNGAYFTGWAYYDQADPYQTASSITVTGYTGTTLVGQASMQLSASQYDWLQADLYAVDRLVFTAPLYGSFWLMDDFTYTTPPIPIPAALPLLLSGLIGLSIIGRRRLAR